MPRRRNRGGDLRVAVAYLRVSTREQRLGPEAQREAIDRWASANGVRVAAWHSDQGVSGAAELDARPGLMSAAESVRAHGAGLLVVAKRDRLGRDIALVAAIERMAAGAGARVVSAAGEGSALDADALDPGALLQRGMHDLLAMHERAVIRHRTRAALAVKKARGERVGRVPLGFRLAADGVRLVPDDAEQAVLTRIRELSASGLTQRALAAALAAEGTVNPRTGRPFTQPSLCCLLNRDEQAA